MSCERVKFAEYSIIRIRLRNWNFRFKLYTRLHKKYKNKIV